MHRGRNFTPHLLNHGPVVLVDLPIDRPKYEAARRGREELRHGRNRVPRFHLLVPGTPYIARTYALWQSEDLGRLPPIQQLITS